MMGRDAKPEINTLPSGQKPIVMKEGFCGGKPHLAGHRIKVQHVAIWHERQGKTPDEIVAEHPQLTLADVHAALAYYYDHKEQIDEDIRADEEFVNAMKEASRQSQLASSKAIEQEVLAFIASTADIGGALNDGDRPRQRFWQLVGNLFPDAIRKWILKARRAGHSQQAWLRAQDQVASAIWDNEADRRYDGFKGN